MFAGRYDPCWWRAGWRVAILGAVAEPDLVTDLVYAQQASLAVEVTLHEGGRLPEPVGVAEVKPEQGWVEFYVADPFGADALARLPLEAIAWVEVTGEEWRFGSAPVTP